MAQHKNIKIVTPKAICVYPWLNRPDTKFNADGEYKVTLKVEAEDAAPLIKQLDEILETYKDTSIKRDPKLSRYSVSQPYEEEMDDQGNLTGYYLFKFKQRAKIHTNDGRTIDMKIAIVDASRTPTDAIIGGGSEVKIAASVYPYAMSTNKAFGLSLRPQAIQILNLVEQKNGNVVSMFDEEDGFKAEAKAPVTDSFTSDEMDTAADF
ncbi:hypothetical protein N9L46_02520 [Amylibacter sp.]|nr:hypothetical protein [Amylibacter sp.]MDA9005827.1 hypothetical protein [Amylibacter sp.]MDB4070911.1 hypothetical protein [Amylibacter sp.]MDB4411502.1 hypothetical protein [bacterium]|tara:strand:- start:7491 stop:8114 length:624 start_codon:yes stop_codon:yes gene_type:complete